MKLLTALLLVVSSSLAAGLPTAGLGQPLAVPLHDEDAGRGADYVRKCQACHDFTEGGPSRIGPPMFGIVGLPAASIPGFNYSRVLMDMRDAGLVWTPEMLAAFLADPRAFAPGNKMSFAGIRREDELSDIVAYLVSISPGYVPATPAAPPPPPTTPSPTDRSR